MRVLFLDTKPFNPNRYISRAVFDALRCDPRVSEVEWCEYINAVPRAMAKAFDLLFAFDGEEMNNVVLHRLLQLVPKKLVWFTEDPYERTRNVAVSRHFDLVFTNDGNSTSFYDGRGIHMPLAGDRERNWLPVRDGNYRYDVFFAGTAWPNRLEFLAQLRSYRPNLRYKLVLVSNTSLDGHIDKQRQGFSFSQGVSIRDFCRLANTSRLTLTLPRKFSGSEADRSAASDTPGPRFFEVGLAGCAQIVDAETTTAASRLFSESEHYFGFRTLGDCIARIDDALADHGGREKVARAAQNHVEAHHLYRHRIAAILDRVVEIQEKHHPAPTKRKHRVLFVSHNIAQHGYFGGAEMYLEAIRKQAPNLDGWILAADHRQEVGQRYILYDGDLSIRDKIEPTIPYNHGALVHREIEANFARILARQAFDVVHFNHLLGFPPSLPVFAKALGATTMYSMHDYFPICHRFNLLGPEDRFCEIDMRPPATCDFCLARTEGLAAGSQARRRRFVRQAFSAIDIVFTGSQAAAALLHTFYPELKRKTRLLPPPLMHQVKRMQRGRSSASLKVAHLGNFEKQKGADTFLEVMQRCKGQSVEFHIFGRIGERYAKTIRSYPQSTVKVHGAFVKVGDLTKLADCDVVLFLSTWPETYGITLSEAQGAGLVPIVTNLGAQTERVKHGHNGFVVPIGDSERVAHLISRLLTNPDELEDMRSRLPSPAGTSEDHFIRTLDLVYSEFAPNSMAPVPDEARTLTLEELGIFVQQPVWAERMHGPSQGGRSSVRFLARRFFAVARSEGWGIALRMARTKLRMATSKTRV